MLGVHLALLSLPWLIITSRDSFPWLGQVNGCLCRRLLHMDCPACGLTRSFWHVLHGQWQAAFWMHPLGPPIAGILLATLMYFGVCVLLGERFGLPWKIETSCYRILDRTVLAGLVLSWPARLFLENNP